MKKFFIIIAVMFLIISISGQAHATLQTYTDVQSSMFFDVMANPSYSIAIGNYYDEHHMLQAEASARSDYGNLGVAAYASVFVDAVMEPFYGMLGVDAYSQANFSDNLYLSGPGSDPVTLILNFLVSGYYYSNVSIGSDTLGIYSYNSYFIQNSEYISVSWDIPVNSIFDLNVQLSTVALAFGYPEDVPYFREEFNNYYGSLTFDPDDPFILPTGYQIASEYGSIPIPEPIPEPSTMLLLASGLIGLVGFRRKFKKN